MTDKVQNMTSNRGNKIANQFVIYNDTGRIFQSYNSSIVKIDGDKTYLDVNTWDYSKTTGKYRNIFLNETKTIPCFLRISKYVIIGIKAQVHEIKVATAAPSIPIWA